MSPRKAGGRGKRAVYKERQFNFRVSEEEYELITKAANGYPPTTWARVELVRLAREKVARAKKGGRK